jgi:hypothetical protein
VLRPAIVGFPERNARRVDAVEMAESWHCQRQNMNQRPLFEWMARIGYAARGGVFLILGIFAALVAIGAHQRTVDTKDALRSLMPQPFGHLLLVLIAAGLMCFAAWRLMEAVLDADHQGNDAKTLVSRAAHAVAAIFYLGFAAVVLSPLLGRGRAGSSDQVAHDWTAWVLGKPFGQWIVGAIGVAITAIGVGIGLKGCWGLRHLELRSRPRRVLAGLGRFGFVARSLVFTMIGVFLLYAALDANSREAKGVAGALQVIQQQPYGSVLLGITAAGLLAFGVYGIAEGAFARITAPSLHQAASKTRLASQ